MKPIVWSRRNGPWRRVSVLWVGAAPGNAGGRGSGDLGAHGTRIPFGGDVAGANLDVFLGSIGLDRNTTFIVAAYNSLPDRGGGEPKSAEIRAQVGDFESSIDVLRATTVAAGPRLVVALGNVALRAIAGALADTGTPFPGLARLENDEVRRGEHFPLSSLGSVDEGFRAAWREAWADDPLPRLLWLTHPSAQNMSPHAGTHTQFHRRMRDALAQLGRGARALLGIHPLDTRAPAPTGGIYALPEWRERIAPVHQRLDALWRGHGI